MARKFLSILCCICLLFIGTSCSHMSPQDIFDTGASLFGQGKTEENYYFKDSGQLLDELINNFSGSYYRPSGTTMSDDEYEKEMQDHQPDPGSSTGSQGGGTSSFNDGDIPEVGDMTDLLRVFHAAYDQTAEYVAFKAVDGFQMNPSTDLQAVYTRLQRDDPIDVSGVSQWSTWNNGTEYYVSITYAYDIDELKSIKQETVKLVEEAIQAIGTEDRSDYEIICDVNAYLCDTVYYPPKEPYAPITHTAYGALKNGCAVCEGYACAAKLLLNGFNIECDIQVGDCLNGGGHAWNLVKLDGNWYQMDITWNDQSFSREDYFLVTDDFMKQSRVWDTNEYPQSAKQPYTP